jgi:enamine deaminase RidA (YjgF/YER057c/UK114 family)
VSESRHIQPACLPQPTGNFTWAVQSGNTVYLSGQVGIDASGKLVGRDAESQARQIYVNIESTLKEMGGDLNSVVRTGIYIVGRENIEAHRRVRRELVAAGRMAKKPASTMLLVEGLADEDWLVEVDAIAVLP